MIVQFTSARCGLGGWGGMRGGGGRGGGGEVGEGGMRL